MNDILTKYKTKIIIGAGALAGIVIFSVIGGGANGTVSDNAKLDQSKKVESTINKDTLDNGAVKMGNIGNVQGGIDLSRKDSHDNVKEGNGSR
jgi:hypothetical protein